jgi:hypothetical protein
MSVRSLIVLILLLAGCAVPMHARTADVLRPGEMRLGGILGGSFGPSKLPDAIIPEVMANWGLTGRLGVANRVEVLADLGWLRQGAAVRYDLTNANRGEWVSLSAFGQGAGKLIIVMEPGTDSAPQYDWGYGGEVGGGLDISVPLWRVVEPLFGASYSWGHQWYNVPKPNPESLHIEESKYQMRSRVEGRLDATIGLAINIQDERYAAQIVLGVSPYWVMGSDSVPGNGDRKIDGVTFTIGGNGLFQLWRRP